MNTSISAPSTTTINTTIATVTPTGSPEPTGGELVSGGGGRNKLGREVVARTVSEGGGVGEGDGVGDSSGMDGTTTAVMTGTAVVVDVSS